MSEKKEGMEAKVNAGNGVILAEEDKVQRRWIDGGR